MTIVLVILAVLILLAVLFLIHRVNKVYNRISSTMTNYYAGVVNHFITLEKNITTQANAIIISVNDAQTNVVQLTNKVDECLTHCGNQTRDLKEKFNTLDNRLTAPIDKINDTHNRIKTLGKGSTSTDELRDIVGKVVDEIARNAVNDTVNKLTKKPKTTKKVANENGIEVKS